MISVFDMFSIGIGPSSSHTVGPMRAALLFAQCLEAQQILKQVDGVRVELYGSLGATGRAHGGDKAVILGKRYPAIVIPESPFDPGNERLRDVSGLLNVNTGMSYIEFPVIKSPS